jgi:CubicO group peptidase (beta-lactamase class C family)
MRLFILLFFLTPLLAIAQLSPADPATAGVSGERLNRVDQFIQNYIDQGRLNGATAIILRDGKMVYNKAFGYSNVEKKTPMQQDQIFRIASMTKPIVSVAVMMLWEEGKFALDDPISKFIPEFKNPVLDKFNPNDTTFTTLPAKREITIRRLLSHTSGWLSVHWFHSQMPSMQTQDQRRNRDLIPPEDNITRVAVLPLSTSLERNTYMD